MADSTNFFQSDLGYVKKVREYTNIINYESYYIHRHSFWEFFLITKGETKHFFNEESSTLKEGEVGLIHPGNDYHYFKDSSVPNYEHRDLYTSTNLFKTICDLIDPDIYACLLTQKNFMTVSLSSIEFKHVKVLFKELYAAQLSNNKQLIYTSYIPLLSFFVKLFAQKYFIGINEKDKEFNDFIATINTPKYICADISDIVKLSNYSHGYLCRVFKERMGETLKSYHVKLKLNYAIDLLCKSDKSILEISSILGYDSLSNFIHVFKSYVGITPAKYRKNILTSTD